MDRPAPQTDVLLDACLDELLRDEDWTAVVSDGQIDDEFRGLMRVAQKLRELGHRAPRLGSGPRDRIFRRWVRYVVEATLPGPTDASPRMSAWVLRCT
jgi:hypothetical protein